MATNSFKYVGGSTGSGVVVQSEVQLSVLLAFFVEYIISKPRSLSDLLMLYPAQSERYFYPVPLNTAVPFEMKQNESIFDPISSWEGLLFVLV